MNFTLLIAGDSNSRMIFRSVQKLVDKHGHITQKEFVTKDGEQQKWSDLEFSGFVRDKLLRVRFVFIHGPGELKEIHTSRANVLLSPMPDLLWFTHGLWHVNTQYKKECRERFTVEGEFIKELQNKTTLVWQTNVKIQNHPLISDDYLLRDTKCQLEWSKNYSVTVFNARQYPVAGFHLKDPKPISKAIFSLIFQAH